MRRFLRILPLVGLLTISLSLPASASTNPSILANARTAVANAAHAKVPHYVTNADLLKLSPTNGNAAVSIVYPLGGFSNARVAGFITTQTPLAQCVLFPARIGAAPSPTACSAKGVPAALWSLRITSAQIATSVNNKAYSMSSAPSITTLNAAAKAAGVVPAGYRVTVGTGTNITPSVKYTVTHLKNVPVTVCVSATTRPGTAMAYIAAYGLAPC